MTVCVHMVNKPLQISKVMLSRHLGSIEIQIGQNHTALSYKSYRTNLNMKDWKMIESWSIDVFLVCLQMYSDVLCSSAVVQFHKDQSLYFPGYFPGYKIKHHQNWVVIYFRISKYIYLIPTWKLPLNLSYPAWKRDVQVQSVSASIFALFFFYCNLGYVAEWMFFHTSLFAMNWAPSSCAKGC